MESKKFGSLWQKCILQNKNQKRLSGFFLSSWYVAACKPETNRYSDKEPTFYEKLHKPLLLLKYTAVHLANERQW